MDKRPAISIIVPVYHVENELKRCLDSLLAQTFSDYEIILINDGGNDAETEICEEYAANNECIVYRYQTNQGVSAARNTGLSVARGGWIMFVDGDDWVSEDFCLKAFESVNYNQAQMAIFDLEYVIGEERKGIIHRSCLKQGIYPVEIVLAERLAGNITGYLCNKIYKRELWDGIIFPVGELWEDDAVFHEVMDRADKIAIIHDVLYYYDTKREDSITHVAFRTGEWTKWLYIQRKKRFLYIKEHRPEMIHIECNAMAGAALGYARLLVKNKNGLSEIREINRWLHTHNVRINNGTVKRRTAYSLLFYCPDIFYNVIKQLLNCGFINDMGRVI